MPTLDSNEELCESCGGDGREHCNNPDHDFNYAIGGETRRLGCPCCRFPDSTLVENGGECEECNGTGLNQPTKERE